MRNTSLMKLVGIFVLVAATPSPAFAAQIINHVPGGGALGAGSLGQKGAQADAQASLDKLSDLVKSLGAGLEDAGNAGIGRRLSQEGNTNFGELLQELTSSIPNLGASNPLSNLGGNLSNLLGGGSSSFGLLGQFNGGDGLQLPTLSDVLGSDTPFSTGSLLMDIGNSSTPQAVSDMLKTATPTVEQLQAISIAAPAFFLTSAICFTVFGGLAIGAFSGQLFAAGLGVITGPYGWGLAVQQTWNNALSPSNTGNQNTQVWVRMLGRTADRINSLNTGSLRQELFSLRGQLSGLLSLLSAIQSRFN